MERLPTAFVSHGAPFSLEDEEWMRALRVWGESLKEVKGVLVLSAHWVSERLEAGPLESVPLIYDFWGFPERLYHVTYSAPPSPTIFQLLKDLPGIGNLLASPKRGLDHGMWVPLKGLFPDASRPVLGLSLPGTDPARLYELGQGLAPLREQGILILASGGVTHNLGALTAGAREVASPWAWEFDQWVKDRLLEGDLNSLFDFRRKAPHAALAHPSIEHFVPLFVALGAAGSGARVDFPVEIFRYGTLSLRSVTFSEGG